jgi:hypothetical protein
MKDRAVWIEQIREEDSENDTTENQEKSTLKNQKQREE